MAAKPPLSILELPEDDLPFRREVTRRLRAIQARGEVGWVQEVTLTANGSAVTTEVVNELVTKDCQISLHAVTPEAASLRGCVWAAAADLVPGTDYTSTPIGKVTIHHPAIVSGQVVTFRLSTKG